MTLVPIAYPRGLRGPVPNVVPLTIRENPSQEYLIEEMRHWIVTSLVPFINTNLDELDAEWVKEVNRLIDAWNEQSAELIIAVDGAKEEAEAAALAAKTAETNAAASAALAEMFASQAENVQDQAISTILNDTSSTFREALDTIYADKAVEATVTELANTVTENAENTAERFEEFTETAELDAFTAAKVNALDSLIRSALDALYPKRATSVVMAADYGVKGDGTNETARITAAVSAASGAGSGVVKFPPGTILTDTINLPQGVAIQGAGKGATKLKHTGTGSAAIMAAGTVTANVTSVTDGVSPKATSIAVVNATGIEAGDLILLHDSYSYTSTDSNYKSGEMLRVRSVVGNTINIYGAVVGSWAALDGIYTPANSARISKVNPYVGFSASDMTITGNPAMGTGGIRLDFCDKGTIDNVDVYDFGGFGFGINTSRDIMISNHTIRDLTDDVPNGLAGYAIYLRGACHNVTIVGGAISRVRHAFTTMGDIYGMAHNVTVVGGTFSETTAAALDTHASGEGITFSSNNVMNCFQGLTSRAHKVVIQDNVFIGTYGSHTITLSEENLRDYVLKGNTIWGSPGAGIMTRNPVIGLTLIDNIIIDSGSDAIFLNPGCSSVLVARNTTRNVGRATGQTNRFHIKAGNASGTTPGVSGGWTIVDNMFIQGSGSAIRAIDLSSDGVTGATICDNKIQGTFAAGSLAGLILATGSLVYNNPWISQAPPAVTGSRGGNVALTNLLTVLAERGIITNSTT